MQRESGSILMRLAPQGIKKQHLTLSMEILPRNSYLVLWKERIIIIFRGKGQSQEDAWKTITSNLM